jgi:hypothetical protein
MQNFILLSRFLFSKLGGITPEKSAKVQNQTWPAFYGPCPSVC